MIVNFSSWTFFASNVFINKSWEKVVMGSGKKYIICAVACGLFATAGVQHSSAQPMHEVCRADIRHYCDTVTPGDGRIMACLYAHEDKIADECDTVTYDVSSAIDSMFGLIANVLSNCTPDIEKYCADLESGQGRILSCLNENAAKLTEPCAEVVPKISGHLVTE